MAKNTQFEKEGGKLYPEGSDKIDVTKDAAEHEGKVTTQDPMSALKGSPQDPANE